MAKTAEQKRLDDHYAGKTDWLKWGPYLSERQWGTVREDYSPDGKAWSYFPHAHARSRVYRWGEDGLAGICDRKCRICFGLALWNGRDPILKERLFGLTGPQGNHGEDVKELYYYLDNTPTHAYMKQLYKYPQLAYPYEELVRINAKRKLREMEYELLDTDLFDEDRYFDVYTTYAKAGEEDLLIKIDIHNRASNQAELTVLPTLWLRNLWSFGQAEGLHRISRRADNIDFGVALVQHPELGEYYFYFDAPDKWLFTHNETNTERLFDTPNASPYVKDLFHDVVTQEDYRLTDAIAEGTKFAPLYTYRISAGESVSIRLRLCQQAPGGQPLGKKFDTILAQRKAEADAFYATFCRQASEDDRRIQRQALAGMLWTKQYYQLDMELWMQGDPGQPTPPETRKQGRNSSWMTLNNEDILSMPDKWEYPWYAAWDLAFHCIPLAMVDAEFAKQQMLLLTREWYMSPNGQIPAYEWDFSDVNPPVQAWAAYEIYKIDRDRNGREDIDFLIRMVNKLGLNFTWWVNRKDSNDNNVFEGGFLGLDNIGVFNRSSQIPGGGHLEQADGTTWMACYCLNMLQICLEIARHQPVYQDLATKYFEHFIYIAESLNLINENNVGIWDEDEGFFYDLLVLPHQEHIPIKVRSLVGLMTLNAVLYIDQDTLDQLPAFKERYRWFRAYRRSLKKYSVLENLSTDKDVLLSLVPKRRMIRLLKALLDPAEFFSSYGIRSLSKVHEAPYHLDIQGRLYGIQYTAAESHSHLFGGNSNWRGPIWMPMNYLFVESLKEYYKYYGDALTIACDERQVTLKELQHVINNRLIDIFRQDDQGDRPVHRLHEEIYRKPAFRDLVLFYEYFHGDTGRGAGASHQTGWTGLVAKMIADSCTHR